MKTYPYILGLVLLTPIAALAQQRPTTMPSQGATIVKMVSRDTTIVARTGAKGPVYSVEQNGTGRVIIPSMTLPELQAKHPDLARQIRSTNASAREIGAWAGVD